MDQFIASAETLAEQLLPILGVVVLVLIVVFLTKINKILDSTNDAIKKAHTTIDLTNQSIEKVQAPLDTVVNVSHTVDNINDSAKKAYNSAKTYVKENGDKIINKVSDLLPKKEQTKEDAEEE